MSGSKYNLEKMIMTALMTALVAVMTMIIAVPVPFTNGYIHLGDSMIFMSVLSLGFRRSPIAAGIGSAFADIFLGYVYWAPWTLVIKGLMAAIAGLLIEKSGKSTRNRMFACGGIILLWLIFNAAVQAIVIHESANNTALLMSAAGSTESAFSALVNKIQLQLMAAALLIPGGLALSGFVLSKKENVVFHFERLLGLSGGGLFMVFGYYIAGGIIYGNFAAAAFSIPANITQFLGGFLVAELLAAALSKTPAHKFFLKLR